MPPAPAAGRPSPTETPHAHAPPRPARARAAVATPLALLLSALASTALHAGPKEELKAATDRMLAARSWQADMVTEGAAGGPVATTAEFVAPDRYRIRNPQGTQLIIGNTMHMTLQGRTMSVPLPPDALAQWRDPAKLDQAAAKTSVTALGSEAVGGKPARKYQTRNADAPAQTVLVWVGADGYPAKMRASSTYQGKPVTTTVTYSRFNDPKISIAAP